MTQEVSYLRVILSAQVEADNAHVRKSVAKAFRTKLMKSYAPLAQIARSNRFLYASISISSS